MKDITSNFWFWLLIFSLLLILISALMNDKIEMFSENWKRIFFIIGAILAVLAIVFLLINWSSFSDNFEKTDTIEDYNFNFSPDYSPDYSPDLSATSLPNSTSSADFSSLSAASPVKSPTRVTSNIAQAQRGFTSTKDSISSLAPK